VHDPRGLPDGAGLRSLPAHRDRVTGGAVAGAERRAMVPPEPDGRCARRQGASGDVGHGDRMHRPGPVVRPRRRARASEVRGRGRPAPDTGRHLRGARTAHQGDASGRRDGAHQLEPRRGPAARPLVDRRRRARPGRVARPDRGLPRLALRHVATPVAGSADLVDVPAAGVHHLRGTLPADRRARRGGGSERQAGCRHRRRTGG